RSCRRSAGRPPRGRRRKLELAVGGGGAMVGPPSAWVGLAASDRLTPRPWPRKVDAQPRRVDLEEHLGLRKAGEAMPTETPEPDADGRGRSHRRARGGGHDDLP